MIDKDLVKKLSLVDLCDPLVDLAAKLEKDHAATSADDLRGKIERRLTEFEGSAQRAGVGMADIEAAKYALVALLDEKLLCSGIVAAAEWLNAPMQMRLFNSFDAGDAFYRRLDDLRREHDGARVLALEVYHLCLALGFKGKYDDRRGEEQRKVLMDQIAQTAAAARGIEDRVLAPRAQTPATAAGPIFKRGLPLWAIPAMSAAAAAIIIVVLYSLIGGAVADFAAAAAGN